MEFELSFEKEENDGFYADTETRKPLAIEWIFDEMIIRKLAVTLFFF
jgi:hypothetical protein